MNPEYFTVQIQLPDPRGLSIERCPLDPDPTAPYALTFFQHPTISELLAPVQQLPTFRLDVSLGRLEFSAHDMMTREEWLALQLLQGVRDRKRRERSGILQHLQRKLLALEEGLLSAREALFERTETGEGRSMGLREGQAENRPPGPGLARATSMRRQNVAAATNPPTTTTNPTTEPGKAVSAEPLWALGDRVRRLELEVAQTRQLVEDEFRLLLDSARYLQRLHAELLQERARVRFAFGFYIGFLVY